MTSSRLFKRKNFQSVFTVMCVCASVILLASCDLAQNQLKHDREGNSEFQETRDTLASRISDTEDDKAVAGNIPALEPYVAQSNERLKSMPLVSISINQTVPIRDALYELAQQADYDIELDPRIRGSVIFTARNRPFDQVVARIANIAGLRYNFDDDILRVELDTPYNKVYKIDYLSYVRNSSGSISNNISVVSGGGNDSGSNFEASTLSEADFWGELETNLEQIIRGTQTGALKTTRDPRITATEQNPNVQAVAPNADGQVNVQAPDAVLRVDSLPVDEEDLSQNGSDQDEPSGTFTINRQAGLINAYATEKAHEELVEYLRLLERAVTSQVLIEAKILEVQLNDQFSTGIDWSLLDIIPSELSVTLDTSATPLPSGASFVANFGGNDVNALVQATSEFGTVKALASPRMTVLNNQTAVLNVATNEVFFEVEVDTTTDEGTTQTDVDSEIRNVPVGVLMNVQPSINLEERTISLALRPTITAISGTEADPSVTFAAADLAISAAAAGVAVPDVPPNLVPELSVQEIDTVIKVRSGQPIVMGGLLQDRIETTEAGVPILSEAPVFGSLFKSHTDQIQKTELVIFLKATILDNAASSIHSTDKDIYRKFSSDRRPLRF